MDAVESELSVCEGPWFLPYLSIVDLTYVTHVERMCASVAYWCGFKVRRERRSGCHIVLILTYLYVCMNVVMFE